MTREEAKRILKIYLQTISFQYPGSIAEAIRTLCEPLPLPSDLDDAAENYYEQDCPYPGEARVVNNEHDVWFPSQAIEDAFKAGAEWQKKQMMEIITK